MQQRQCGKILQGTDSCKVHESALAQGFMAEIVRSGGG